MASCGKGYVQDQLLCTGTSKQKEAAALCDGQRAGKSCTWAMRTLSLEASAVDIGVNVHPRVKEGVSEQRSQDIQGKIDHCLGKYS